jgi:beta-galactosidase
VWDEKTASLLDYVSAGGHLILGARSGCKTEDNALLTDAVPPGRVLGDALGATVWEYYPLETPLSAQSEAGAGAATIWAEWLCPKADDVEVVLRYDSSHPWLSGQPAMVTRSQGHGRISYLGVWPDDPLLQSLIGWVGRVSPLPEPLPTEEGVVMHRRFTEDDKSGEVRIVLNMTTEERVVAMEGSWRDVLSERVVTNSLSLSPRSVAVLVGAA